MRFANSDPDDARALAVQPLINGGTELMSVEMCIGACEAGGYSLAGLEFANECCTCFTSSLDALSSPDQTSLFKGVAMYSIKATLPRC